MFEQITERLQSSLKSLSGNSVLTEKNIDDSLRDVRRALLEADVNYQVVKEFISEVREECLGEKVLKSVSPGEQAVKVVHDHLVSLLGDANVPLNLTEKPAAVMMVGLHGSGKTTTAAKLGRYLQQKEGKKVLLAACDLHRPAAIDQLETLGAELGLPVFSDRDHTDVVKLAADARKAALDQGADVLILDTAGRHQIDEELVKQLDDIRQKVRPEEILLVADAALGQQAVSVAEHFDEALGISGLVLTKMDGDARGGAALSMRRVTGEPIKFIGVGEKPADLEPFYPDRMASRILGMGDVVSLVEKASEEFEEEEAQKMEEKMRKQQFDYNDFLKQLQRMQKMGGMMSMLEMLPGMGGLKDNIDVDDGQFKRIEGIICAMTPEERENPGILKASRRQRIARGSGVAVKEVNDINNRFETMRKMMGNMDQMEEMMEGMQGGGMEGLAGFGGAMGGAGTGGGGQKARATKKKAKSRRQKTKTKKQGKKSKKKKK